MENAISFVVPAVKTENNKESMCFCTTMCDDKLFLSLDLALGKTEEFRLSWQWLEQNSKYQSPI